MSKSIQLTDFEIDVITSILETALNGWEGNQARQNAAQRVIEKLERAQPDRERESRKP